MHLLNVNTNAKTVKNFKKGHLTGVLYLTPSVLLCPACSEGCRRSCLYTAGRGRFEEVKKARANRTRMFFKEPQKFYWLLHEDITQLQRKARKLNLKPSVRINGTSDIDVAVVFKDLLEAFPKVQFYDYTKRIELVQRELPKNYYLCFSRSEKTSEETIKELLTNGTNVVIVFDEVPEEYLGYRVVNGDETDLRFLDPKGVIVGLKAKGEAKKDTTGFVVKLKGK